MAMVFCEGGLVVFSDKSGVLMKSSIPEKQSVSWFIYVMGWHNWFDCDFAEQTAIAVNNHYMGMH